MVHLRYNLFPCIHAKLEKQKCGPFQMAWKINDNTYLLQLPDDWNISHIFNLVDLSEYHPDYEELCEPNSRMSSFLSEGD